MNAKKFNSTRPHIILIIPAVIAGGAALAGAGLTAHSQGKMNKRAERFQREMFDKTNVYNDPLQQRQRLERAGLNPNLIYGSSPSAAAGEAKQPAQPDLKAQDFSIPGAAVGGALSQIYQVKTAQAGIEQANARTENLKSDTINKGIESVNAALRASSGAIDLKTKKRLYDNTVSMAEEQLRNLSIQTGYTENKDAREQMIANETAKNLRIQGRILNSEDAIKKIDAHLYKEYGLKPADPYYIRILHNILEKLDLNPFKD